jgi:predicted DNA-binding ribbon-helix-helix protein
MSQVAKRSIVIRDHKTSVSLEAEFWASLREIALRQGKSLRDVVSEIDATRAHPNLSCAIRLFVLDYYQSRARMVPHPAKLATSGFRPDGSPGLEASSPE